MRRSGSVLLFVAISLALHLVWVVWMPAGESSARPVERWVEVSFEEVGASPAVAVRAGDVVKEAPADRERPAERVVTGAVSSSSPSTSTSTSTSTLPSPSTSKSTLPSPSTSPTGPSNSPSNLPSKSPMRVARARLGVVPPLAAETASSMELPGLPPSAAEPAAQPEKAATVPVLSPRAAALSVEAFARGPAFRCAAPAAGGRELGPNDCAPAEDRGEAAQAALQRDLDTVAKAVPHLKTREAPNLRRRSDGSYAYDGHVFQALLQPNGQVEFTDNAAQAQLSVSLTPIKVVADVNDLVEHNILGRELYSAEKQWFLEQTRELRLQLSAAARRQELQAANRALERTLQEVLGDSALSTPQKHDAVFLIWQDCGEDAQQTAHRRSVEAFVRRYMPQTSENGFREEELERFNRERGSLQKFEPYSDSKG